MDHPLLGSTVELADGRGGGLLQTGRLSLQTHPWLADHRVAGAALLPGTAFLELALRAAEQVGAETVEELTLQAPLILPETGAVAIQVSVSGLEDGRREISIHSRPEGEEEEWTQNATGALSDTPIPTPEPMDTWPPEGAEPIELDYLYDVLAEHGLEYGPAFQGLSAAWREGEQIFVEASVPEESAEEARRFAIHPALLDAALHSTRLAAIEEQGQGPSLPSTWSGVSLAALGATELRTLAREAQGKGAGPESSVLKIKGTEIQQRITELTLEAVGVYGAPYFRGFPVEGGNAFPIGPEYAHQAAPAYANMRKTSIYGGSNEIQRNIIAKMVLGL